jgi:Na+/H+-dicarboxylate symporter
MNFNITAQLLTTSSAFVSYCKKKLEFFILLSVTVNIRIKIYKAVILPLVYVGVILGLFHSGKNIGKDVGEQVAC